MLYDWSNLLNLLLFQSGAVKRFIPMFDRVLLQRAEAISKTKGGIMIPEKAQQKVSEATVVAVGPGFRTEVRKRTIAVQCLWVCGRLPKIRQNAYFSYDL